MENVFLKILNMSISAGYLVIAVIFLRFVLKKAPKWIRGIFWAFVGIRLVCPFSFESVLSLIPSSQTVPEDIIYSQSPQINSGFASFNSVVNPVISETFAPNTFASVNPLGIVTAIAGYIWIFGIVLMLSYAVFSYAKIRRKVSVSINLKENIYLCDNISAPFILGIIKPKIYLPSDISQDDIVHVTAHEKAHINRLDHFWKPLGFVLLSIYWFNPLMWVSYILLCRDIELSCDEKVIKMLGNDIKKAYSETLINLSVPQRHISACPVAFSEINVKNRIKGILSYKKPAFWVIAVSVVLCVVTAVCFLTNPKESSENNKTYENFITVTEIGSDVENVKFIINDIYKENEKLYFSLRWDNGTIQNVYYGEQFSVLKKSGNNYFSIKEDLFWHLPLYIVSPNILSTVRNLEKVYDLTSTFGVYDDPGDYIFETEFTFENNSDTKYKIWIAFTITDDAQNPSSFEVLEAEKGESIVFTNFYTCVSGNDSYSFKDMASLNLNTENKTFSFSQSYLSSSIHFGTYEESEDYIYCKENGRDLHYTFKKQGENLVFVANESSKVEYFRYESGGEAQKSVVNGAVFKLINIINQVDSIDFDIDSDGVSETITLYSEPSTYSHSAFFRIEIFDNGELKYEQKVSLVPGDLKFYEKDGTLQIINRDINSGEIKDISDVLLSGDEIVINRKGNRTEKIE